MFCCTLVASFIFSSEGAQDFDITLNGEGADVDVKGVSLLLSEARQARVGVQPGAAAIWMSVHLRSVREFYYDARLLDIWDIVVP